MGRRCGRCGLEKPFSEFAWKRKHKGQRDTYCRPCRAAYKQEHYAKNRQRYIDNAARNRRRMLEERMRFIIDFLRRHPCVDCGETDVLVLDFDHIEEKAFNVSWGLTSKSWDEVLAEIDKCEVVCSNCHRRRTAKRGGFLRALLADEESG